MISARPLALSAGTLRAAPRPDAVRAAAAAGFTSVGVRFDVDPPSLPELVSLRAALSDTEVSVLDVEVVRIVPGDDVELARRLCTWGEEVGASFLLVVSDDRDRSRTVDRFAETAAVAAGRGMRAVLEFMRFTAVATLGEAVAVVEEAGIGGAGVLVDPLHLARSGGHPSDVTAIDPKLLPYAQLCDAPSVAPGAAGLAEEARHHRLEPGSGDLPLADLLAALPDGSPLSVEILSDAYDELPPGEVASRAMDASRRVLSGAVTALGRRPPYGRELGGGGR